jgi:hypothetical protein
MVFRMINFITGFGIGIMSGSVLTVGSMYQIEYLPQLSNLVRDSFIKPTFKKIKDYSENSE